MQHPARHGFTLIELSIVLVIIGLIIGGVLTGKDLITAAETRATISQIESYNLAANAFRTKYGGLPGDIAEPGASASGFKTRGAYSGQGDGNGVLEGRNNNAPDSSGGSYTGRDGGFVGGVGEPGMFWVDLSTAGMIDGSFTLASPDDYNVNIDDTEPGRYFREFFPPAKLGGGNYIYVTSKNGINYFGISSITVIYNGAYLWPRNTLPVMTTYNIDKKIDDGAPMSGKVLAQVAGGFTDTARGIYWVDYTGYTVGTPYTTALPAADASCFDNDGASGTTMHYSTQQNGGIGRNCSQIIRFQ